MNCDVCGKGMTDENGQSFIGESIELNIGKDESGHEFKGEINPQEKGCMTAFHFQVNMESNPMSPEFIKKQLGKFEVNRRYNICWECWLKSLGIKASESKEAV